MIVSVNEETAFNKIQHSHGKNFLQIRNRMEIPQSEKGHLGKTQLTSYQMGKY